MLRVPGECWHLNLNSPGGVGPYTVVSPSTLRVRRNSWSQVTEAQTGLIQEGIHCHRELTNPRASAAFRYSSIQGLVLVPELISLSSILRWKGLPSLVGPLPARPLRSSSRVGDCLPPRAGLSLGLHELQGHGKQRSDWSARLVLGSRWNYMDGGGEG